MQPDPQNTTGRTIARILVVSAAATLVIAIVLGALVSPPLYAIALLAVFDLALAWAFQTGRLKPATGTSTEDDAESGADAADASDADPSHNPYARED